MKLDLRLLALLVLLSGRRPSFTKLFPRLQLTPSLGGVIVLGRLTFRKVEPNVQLVFQFGFMRQSFEGPTKKLSVILEAKLHGRAKRFALVNDMTLTELIVTALEERLAVDSQAGSTSGDQLQAPSRLERH